MKLLKYYTTVFLFVFFLIPFVYGQNKQNEPQFVTDVGNVGTSAATFLEIGVGARAMAMGGAYAAVANDVSALYWNPAGIAWVDGYQVEFMHNDWIANTNFDFAGIVIPLPVIRSTIGFSYTTLDYGTDVVRTVDRPEGTGEKFSARDIAVCISIASALTDRFAFGLSGKYVNQRIWSETGSAMALDFGVFYNTMLEGLRLGASMANFGNEIQLSGRNLRNTIDTDKQVANFDRVPVNLKTGAYPLPLLFRVGISYEKTMGAFGNMLLSMDVNHPSNATESINFGFEYGFANMFYLRGGYENYKERDSINGMTLGGGVNIYKLGSTGIRIDYAWSDWGILENAQRFSVGVLF